MEGKRKRERVCVCIRIHTLRDIYSQFNINPIHSIPFHIYLRVCCAFIQLRICVTKLRLSKCQVAPPFSSGLFLTRYFYYCCCICAAAAAVVVPFFSPSLFATKYFDSKLFSVCCVLLLLFVLLLWSFSNFRHHYTYCMCSFLLFLHSIH